MPSFFNSASWREGFGGTWLVVLAALSGALVALTVAARGARVRTRAEIARRLLALLPDRNARALRRAARSGDPAAFRTAALALLEGGAIADAALLGPLDRHLFGPLGAARPDLRALAATVARRLRGS